MRVCVCTVVHHAEDARILHRQIQALLDAGETVTYLAPFSASGASPWPSLTGVDVPRARGLRRIAALWGAWRALGRHARDADVLLVHDPELLLVLPFLRRRPVTVWDVHEDTASALVSKPWLPRPLRTVLRPLVRAGEMLAERRLRLLLAEDGYRDRFRRDHPVVPNTTYVPTTPPPPPSADRVVYLGHLTDARGVGDLIETARLLEPEGITTELIGGADAQSAELLRDAHRTGLVQWHGYQSNGDALVMVQGALAGLSLLHDLPNYRHSVPTKVVEYMAHGIPVVTTPVPPAAAIVAEAGCGLVVPYKDPAAAAAAVLRLRDDPVMRTGMADRGHEAARRRFHWPHHGSVFVNQLREWAHQPSPREPLVDGHAVHKPT
ncbi:glycosyltransferase [Actinomadura alba]|uniref:Glycosyltransferase n=1 Tax=Actinomadura alba TaxID=406431 RepID=A0ABR7LK94_9ACTN|nr:glycosyltransferase [Actinomadura alba]MBC6464803.1 glycosyltransferase [Actinomadura alba]